MSVYKTQYWCSQGRQCLFIARGQGRRVLASVVAAELEADETKTYVDLNHYCGACQLVFCSLQCKLHARESNNGASGGCAHYNSKGKAYSPKEIIATSKADKQRYEARKKSGITLQSAVGSGAAAGGRKKATHKRPIEQHQQDDSADEEAAAAAMLQLNKTQQQAPAARGGQHTKRMRVQPQHEGQQGQQNAPQANATARRQGATSSSGQQRGQQRQKRQVAPPAANGAAAAVTRPVLQEPGAITRKSKRINANTNQITAEETAAAETVTEMVQQPSRRSRRLHSGALAAGTVDAIALAATAAAGLPPAGTTSSTMQGRGGSTAALAAAALQQLGLAGNRHVAGQTRTARTGAAAAAAGGGGRRVHGPHARTRVQSGSSVLTQLDYLAVVAAAAAAAGEH